MNYFSFLCTGGGLACDTFWITWLVYSFIQLIGPLLLIYVVFRLTAIFNSTRSVRIISLCSAAAVSIAWYGQMLPSAAEPFAVVAVVLPFLVIAGYTTHRYANDARLTTRLQGFEIQALVAVGAVSLPLSVAMVLLMIF